MACLFKFELRNATLLSLSLCFAMDPTEAFGNSDQGCVPPRQDFYVPFQGQYHRMHPSGTYFIYTKNKSSFVVDLSNPTAPLYLKSAMREEAYPVEAASGGWDLVAAPVDGGWNGPKGGTEYYRFDDVASSLSDKAKPTYVDSEHGEFYLSSAELPGSSDETKEVRTLLLSDQSFRDYKFEMSSDGSIKKATPGPIKRLCEGAGSESEKPAIWPNRRLQELETKLENIISSAQVNVAEAKAVIEEIFLEEKKQTSHLGESFADKRRARNLILIPLSEATVAVRNFKPYLEALRRNEIATENYSRKTREIEESIWQASRDELKSLSKAFQNEKDPRKREELQRKSTEQQARILAEIDKKLAASSKLQNLKREMVDASTHLHQLVSSDGPIKVLRDLKQQLASIDTELSWMQDRKLRNPILSKDGTHVAGLVNERLHVFKISENGTCEKLLATEFRSSKVSFSYPKRGENLKVTFTAIDGAPNFRASAYVMDTKTGQAEVISESGEKPYYPGFLLDGRVMYRSGDKMLIVDPEAKQGRKCIVDSGRTREGTSKETSK